MKKDYLQPTVTLSNYNNEDVLRSSNTNPILEDPFNVQDENCFF